MFQCVHGRHRVATEKDARAAGTDDRMRVSRPVGRLLRPIASLKRWSRKTAAQACVEHFADQGAQSEEVRVGADAHGDGSDPALPTCEAGNKPPPEASGGDETAEVAVGFEPTNNGFAIRPLGPLGYATEGLSGQTG